LYSFDSSAIIDLWVNYPIQNPHFKPIWGWFYTQVKNEKFVISETALKEVKAHILYDKLEKNNPESKKFIDILDDFIIQGNSRESLRFVMKVKKLLNIEEENYGKGVGENDLYIIANAKIYNTILVNNENIQFNPLPIKKFNYKIPAVCGMTEIGVKSINLVDLLNIKDLW
jgi:hypothetical protein